MSGQNFKMSGQNKVTVKQLAAITGRSESTIKRKLKSIDAKDFEQYIDVSINGKRKAYLIDKNYGIKILGERSFERSKSESERSKSHNERSNERSNNVSGQPDAKPNTEHLKQIKTLEAQLITEQDKAASERAKLLELIEKQQDQTHSEREDFNKRLSESNALQLHLQNQLKATSDQLQLLKSATEENAQIESSSSKPANYAWLVLALFIFIVLAALIVNMANGAW